MITLRNAREKAEKIVGWAPYPIPSMSTLGDWRRYGCLSDPVEYKNQGRGGGRVGLYHDSLPVQIAVTAELKGTYELEMIGELASQVRSVKFGSKVKVAKKYYAALQVDGEDVLEAKSEGNFEEAQETLKRKYLFKDYLSAWKKYENRYEKLKTKH